MQKKLWVLKHLKIINHIASTIQIWNLTPIFKALLFPSHLALWVILRRCCTYFSLVLIHLSKEKLLYKIYWWKTSQRIHKLTTKFMILILSVLFFRSWLLNQVPNYLMDFSPSYQKKVLDWLVRVKAFNFGPRYFEVIIGTAMHINNMFHLITIR